MKRKALEGLDLYAFPNGMHTDGNGLGLLVSGVNARSWVQRLRVKHGPDVTLGLGSLDLVPLTEAREIAIENHRKARQGINPKPEKPITYDTFAERWLKDRLTENPDWSERKNYDSRMRRIILPVIGKIPIDKVDASHVRAIRDSARSVSEKKSCVRHVSNVLDFAIAEGLRPDNPCPAIQKHIRMAPTEHRKFIPAAELKELLPRITTSDAPECIKAFLLFAAVVPLRHDEIRLAEWSEFERNVWTVPASRMKKATADFTLDVPDTAMALLPKPREGSRYVFAYNDNGLPPVQRTNTRWKNRLGLGDMDVHGARTSFLSWCGDNDIDHSMGERCLAHSVDGSVTKAYLRTGFRKQRKELLERYCRYMAPVSPRDNLMRFIS